MFKSFFILLFACWCVCSSVVAQQSYIITPSSINFGIDVIDNGLVNNCLYCEYKQGGNSVKASPEEVLEYITGEFKYIRKKIVLNGDSSLVFVKVCYEGEPSLLHYKGKTDELYIVVEDSVDYYLRSTENDKDQYKGVLRQLKKQPYDSTTYDVLKYNAYVLNRYVDDLNTNRTCPFPRWRYGLVSHVSCQTMFTELSSDPQLETLDVNALMGWSVGAFFNAPLKASQYSLQTEFSVLNMNSVERRKTDHYDVDLLIDVMYAGISQLLRYTFPTQRLHPYVELGVAASFKVDDGSTLAYALIQDGAIFIKRPYQPLLFSPSLVGVNAGAGFDFAFSSLNLGVGLNYNVLYAFDNDYHNRGMLALDFCIYF